jgi:hypothetical protein
MQQPLQLILFSEIIQVELFIVSICSITLYSIVYISNLSSKLDIHYLIVREEILAEKSLEA